MAAAASRACVRGQGTEGSGGVGTHAAQHWVQLTGECGSLWLAKYNKSSVNLPDHG